MAEYDFRTLSPIDFEVLCRDLLQAQMARRFESFKSGRDQGVDLRAFVDDSNELVVQCKHYVRSGVSKLKSHLRLSERSKVEKLEPSRYVVATSVPLSRKDKADIVAIFDPYILSQQDVYGAEDLNNLLEQFPDIQRNHYKLWITSTTVLDRLVHADMFQRSELEREEIEKRLALHVQTNATQVAWEILERSNYCIISGIPGIGKTTLAEILVADLISREHELLVARTHIDEVMGRIEPDKPCVVYYDDFLGQSTFSEKLGKNEEKSLFRLLQMAQTRPNLKVILTTREYILADARGEYERLNDSAIDLGKCVVDLATYTRGDRARILYNHLYFYDIPKDQLDFLLDEDRYLDIVDHKNYNPRAIEWVVRAGEASESIYSQLRTGLDDPTRIWSNVFEKQLNEDARDVLLVLATLSSTTRLSSLRQAFVATSGRSEREDKMERRFREALRTLDGTFLATMRDRGEFLVQFSNPSVRDFLHIRIVESKAVQKVLAENSVFFEQLDTLFGRRSGKEPLSSIPFNQIARTVTRLFFAPADGVHRVYIGRQSSTYSWWPNRRRLGGRARSILEWIGKAGSRTEHDGLLVELLAKSLDDPEVSDVGELCQLTEVLLEIDSPREVLERARERFLSEADFSTDLADWSRLATIVSNHPTVFRPEEFSGAAHDAVKTWIENDPEYDSPDERDYDCGNMVVIAKVFELNLGDDINALKNSNIIDVTAPEPEPRGKRAWHGQAESDREILDLFASLREES